MDLISEREAAARLRAAGLSLSASQHLLATGIAGEPLRTRAAKLYDASAIDEVVTRAPIAAEELDATFPVGVVVVRLPRGRTMSAHAAWPDIRPILVGPWPVGAGDGFAMTGSVAFGDGLSLVLSVSGFVIAGAEVSAVFGGDRPGLARLEVDPPGPWFGALRGRRMRGHRGRPVELVGWRPHPTGPRMTRF